MQKKSRDCQQLLHTTERIHISDVSSDSGSFLGLRSKSMNHPAGTIVGYNFACKSLWSCRSGSGQIDTEGARSFEHGRVRTQFADAAMALRVPLAARILLPLQCIMPCPSLQQHGHACSSSSPAEQKHVSIVLLDTRSFQANRYRLMHPQTWWSRTLCSSKRTHVHEPHRI